MQTDSLAIARQIGPIIDVLSEKFKVPAKFLWQTMIRQVYIDFMLATILFVVCLVVFLVLLNQARKEREDRYYDNSGWIIGSVISGILSVIFFGLFLVNFGYILNPEYVAITRILNIAQ